MTDTVRIVVEVDVNEIELTRFTTPEDVAVQVVRQGIKAEEDPGVRVVDVELLA